MTKRLRSWSIVAAFVAASVLTRSHFGGAWWPVSINHALALAGLASLIGLFAFVRAWETLRDTP